MIASSRTGITASNLEVPYILIDCLPQVRKAGVSYTTLDRSQQNADFFGVLKCQEHNMTPYTLPWQILVYWLFRCARKNTESQREGLQESSSARVVDGSVGRCNHR